MVSQYKESIKRKYEHRNESSFSSGERVSLAALYTEPVIIQKNEKGGFQNISVEELFNKLDIHLYYPSSVILQGNSGSGKSFLVQKIILDWASEQHYLKDFNLAFYLSCEELKCISEEMNLIELLSWNCGLSPDQISEMVQKSSQRVLFIIDGLDDLDELIFMCDNFCISSEFQRAPPEVIVCSLLRQQILPRSVRLITTRTEVPQGMFLKGPQRFTEIMGFSEKGVEEYFQKSFQNEELFRKAYECVRVNETLITACSIPVICWIICTVMRERFSDGADVTSVLETSTSIYVDFVSTLLEHHCQGLSQSVPSLLRSLGQLAERGMLEQQVLFDEKTVYDTISDPAGNPFLFKFLLKRKIHQETMFSFMHLSFQEFFTALYYVLLDEEESQRKVRELLHTVERGWALSCWSDRGFSKANLEISNSKLLQPVILFLCGLCKKEWISSFFEKHNMTVSVNIETHLKEWIIQCSQRYQNEHMLFILHCLYELHEKSFVGKVLEQLASIDLSNILLKNADCWMLRFCFQNCVNIGKLRLNITSDNLKILQSALISCEELWLKVDHITDDTGDLISALGKGKIVKELIIQEQKASQANHKNSRDSSGDGFFLLDVLHSVSGLKKVHLQMDKLTVSWIPTILSLVQAFPSLNELSWRKSVLIKRDKKGFIKEDLKTIKTENIESKRAESSLGQSSSGYAEVFTPECVQQDDEDKHKTKYRYSIFQVCVHAGQFQCSLTSLVFVMEGEGEVLYNIVSWDPGLGQLRPAGPLYNIECSAGSVSELHFQHCMIFSEENKDCLAVAHFTGGNVEIIQPLKVTETHVIIDIRDLSIFGLIWIKTIFGFPIKGQVLLFLRPVTVKQKILNVHLLPGNVPVSEVQGWHLDKKYIETSSKCHLFPEREYSLCCQPEDCEVQPVSEMFELDHFGPNYHPTFEVFLDVNVEEVRLGVLDKTRDGKEVWKRRRILLTVAPSKDVEHPAHRRIPETEFVNTHRDELIQRVSSVMAIADSLLSKNMIDREMYDEVHTEKKRTEKMRLLLDAVDSGGAAVKAEFCRLLKEKEHYLVDELGPHL
ncbi:NACHT, LRR and PYD domains-containing protein 1 homolog [Cyprinus carpio]|uniref:NACHT, LRR and PYD domains-containing protein 1 homolog n=1 Tax=Cyprinus carpio TaxID=7962 RepID=A0A9R0B750_CYPCA|nr:NACHT, LRR and PYD domains-containing protein 1 homolog [Cyprinus carpio]